MKNQFIYLNQIQKAANKFAMILTASAAIALVGCSGASSPGAANGLNNYLNSGDSTAREAKVREANTRFKAIADAIPQFGSTTQSSEGDDRVGIADENAVSISSNGQIDSVSVTIVNSGGSGVTWMTISTADTILGRRQDDAGNHLQLEKAISGGGTLYLDAFTDIDSPTPTTRIEDVATEAESVGVGSTLRLIRDLATLDGVPGETVCDGIDNGPCFFYDNDGAISEIITPTFFIPEDSTERVTIMTGQIYIDYEDEVEINGVLGTLNVTPNSECSSTNFCRLNSEFLDDGSQRITLAEGPWTFTPYSGQTLTLAVTEDDTDYLVGGVWVYIPENGGGDLEVGAFADGALTLTNLPNTGTATYTGNAYGIRLIADTSSNFSADVRLEADFTNSTSTISGMLTGSDLPSALTLGSSDINGDGFFNDGTTSMEGGYTGKWGGQFYGDGASSAAGTFGVSKGAAGEDDADSFIGFFGATVESTE